MEWQVSCISWNTDVKVVLGLAINVNQWQTKQKIDFENLQKNSKGLSMYNQNTQSYIQECQASFDTRDAMKLLK